MHGPFTKMSGFFFKLIINPRRQLPYYKSKIITLKRIWENKKIIFVGYNLKTVYERSLDCPFDLLCGSEIQIGH